MGGGSSRIRFAVLSKMVHHMGHRHMEEEDMPLKLDEILDETNQIDVSSIIKLWLSTESLRKNPKIDARESGHETPDYGPEYAYLFKPPYNIKNKKTATTDTTGLRAKRIRWSIYGRFARIITSL